MFGKNKKIDKLTAEQEALMPAYRDKWIGIGLSTDPLPDNKEVIESTIRTLYRNAMLQEPKSFHYVSSPRAAVDYIKNTLHHPASLNTILSEMSYGCHEAAWLSYYDFFIHEVGVKNCEQVLPLIELSKHCGWISFYDTDVIVQERPSVIKMDDQNRLHSETGPAISYSDGYSVYAWHGVTIPSEWIEKRSELSPKTALTWQNMEQRRAACEIVGWSRILRELDATVIDSDEDPMVGTLIETNIPEVGKERFLKVLCGTGREFAIPVPPTVTTALEANAWTFNLDGDTLRKLEVRT